MGQALRGQPLTKHEKASRICTGVGVGGIGGGGSGNFKLNLSRVIPPITSKTWKAKLLGSLENVFRCETVNRFFKKCLMPLAVSKTKAKACVVAIHAHVMPP